MRIKLDFEWEKLDENTARIKVIGGWLMLIKDGKNATSVFVPDKDHGWMIVKRIQEMAEKNP